MKLCCRAKSNNGRKQEVSVDAGGGRDEEVGQLRKRRGGSGLHKMWVCKADRKEADYLAEGGQEKDWATVMTTKNVW